MRYSATDPIWAGIDADPELVGLREHIRRLCVLTNEMSFEPLAGGWGNVGHNLRLAFSLVDLFADTDVEGASMWCSPVADYETADGELTEKHLAAAIVFNFVWTAYECAVELLTAPTRSRGGKGAIGRDLVATVTSAQIPFLRRVLMKALELDRGGTDFDHPEMRKMLRRGSIPGVAGEYLRQFRNRLSHGDIRKPEPKDWGEDSEYVADEDPHLRRFQHNIRLVLYLIQLLAADDIRESATFGALFDSEVRARAALQWLHCSPPDRLIKQVELLTDDERLLAEDAWLT